jgi:hypothetical protein
MTRYANLQKLVTKNKKKNFVNEDQVSFKEIKRERSSKKLRNYDNALRAKNLDRLLSYDD